MRFDDVTSVGDFARSLGLGPAAVHAWVKEDLINPVGKISWINVYLKSDLFAAFEKPGRGRLAKSKMEA